MRAIVPALKHDAFIWNISWVFEAVGALLLGEEMEKLADRLPCCLDVTWPRVSGLGRKIPRVSPSSKISCSPIVSTKGMEWCHFPISSPRYVREGGLTFARLDRGNGPLHHQKPVAESPRRFSQTSKSSFRRSFTSSSI